MKTINLSHTLLSAALGTAFVAATAPAAQARVFDYHPNAVYRLGEAFDPADPFDDKSKAGCYKWKNEELVREGGAPDDASAVEANVTEVRSRSELYERLNISASVSARYTFVKGRATFSQDKRLEFNERTLTYVFHGSRVYSKEKLEGKLKLTLKGRWLLWKARRKNNPNLFFKTCGSEIVTTRIRGANVAVVYQFQTSTAEKAQKLRATLDAKFKSGSASFSLSQEMRKVDQRTKVQIFAMQTGTDQAEPALLDLIELEPGNIRELKKTLKRSILEIDRDSSPVLQVGTMSSTNISAVRRAFGTGTLSDFGLIDQELVTLHDRYNLISKRVGDLRALLDRHNPHEFTDGSYEQIQDDVRGLEAVRDLVITHARRCLGTSVYDECHGDIPVLPPYLPSRYVNGYVAFHGWGNTAGASVWGAVNWNGHAVAWPVLRFRNLELIDHVVIQRNGNALFTLTYPGLIRVNEAGGSLRSRYSVDARVVNRWCWQANPNCKQETLNAVRGKLHNQEKSRRYRAVIKTVDGKVLTVPFRSY